MSESRAKRPPALQQARARCRCARAQKHALGCRASPCAPSCTIWSNKQLICPRLKHAGTMSHLRSHQLGLSVCAGVCVRVLPHTIACALIAWAPTPHTKTLFCVGLSSFCVGECVRVPGLHRQQTQTTRIGRGSGALWVRGAKKQCPWLGGGAAGALQNFGGAKFSKPVSMCSDLNHRLPRHLRF